MPAMKASNSGWVHLYLLRGTPNCDCSLDSFVTIVSDANGHQKKQHARSKVGHVVIEVEMRASQLGRGDRGKTIAWMIRVGAVLGWSSRLHSRQDHCGSKRPNLTVTLGGNGKTVDLLTRILPVNMPPSIREGDNYCSSLRQSSSSPDLRESYTQLCRYDELQQAWCGMHIESRWLVDSISLFCTDNFKTRPRMHIDHQQKSCHRLADVPLE